MSDKPLGFLWMLRTTATTEQIAQLRAYRDDGDTARFDKLLAEIEQPEPVKPVRVVVPKTGSAAARGRAKFTQTTFTRACEEVATAPEGQRNPTLARMSYKLGMFVGGGHLDEQTARDGLLNAGRKCGLPDWESLKTIDNSLKKGMQIPFVFRSDR